MIPFSLKNLPILLVVMGVTVCGLLVKVHIGNDTKLAEDNDELRRSLAEVNAAYATERGNHQQTKESFESYRSTVSQEIEGYQSTIAGLQMDFDISEAKRNELSNRLGKHDFPYLAMEKPGLISTITTRATRQLFNSLNALTARATSPSGSSGGVSGTEGVPEAVGPQPDPD